MRFTILPKSNRRGQPPRSIYVLLPQSNPQPTVSPYRMTIPRRGGGIDFAETEPVYLATPAGDGPVDHSNLPATHGSVTFARLELGVLP